jgi:ABC-type transport system substrate-binding protein
MDSHLPLPSTDRWQGHQISRRKLVQLLSAGIGVTLFAPDLVPTAAARQDASSTPVGTPGGEVRMLIRKPVTLNPYFSTSGNEQQMERLIFGALIKMNDKLEPVLDLAEKVEASPDATNYTFTLREGLVFNDGEPLTSRDVAFTIERAVDRRTGSLWRGRLLAITGAEAYGDQQAETISGLETPDERTVSITLDKADASFLITLGDYSGLAILPEHVHKDVVPEEWANIRQVRGRPVHRAPAERDLRRTCSAARPHSALHSHAGRGAG